MAQIRCYLPFAQTALLARGGSTQQDKGGAAMHAGAIQINIWVMAPSKTTKQPEKFFRNLETKAVP